MDTSAHRRWGDWNEPRHSQLPLLQGHLVLLLPRQGDSAPAPCFDRNDAAWLEALETMLPSTGEDE